MMDDLIKLVRTYRFTAALSDRNAIADRIFSIIGPDLHLFVHSRIKAHVADDVFNEVLAAIAKSLKSFKGDSAKQFLKWCYAIARNKVYDHHRKDLSDRLVFEPLEDLLEKDEAKASYDSLSAGIKHDLEYVMGLLKKSNPECGDFLWSHFYFGFDYTDIAEQLDMTYDGVRMKIGRCLEEAKQLAS